jgi:hypothetical protein
MAQSPYSPQDRPPERQSPTPYQAYQAYQPPQPYPAALGAPPHPPGRRSARGGPARILVPVATGVVGIIVGAVAASAGGSSTATTASTASTITTSTIMAPAGTVTVTAQRPPAGQATAARSGVRIPGDGTFPVPGDVKPGTYTSARPALNCYWARLKSLDGSLNAIIANGNSAGPATVTVKATDKGFQTTGCAEWVKVR